jgi:hypothetical protein
MISKILLLFISLISITGVSAQEKIWTKQSKLSEIIAFEKAIATQPKILNQNVSLSKDYYPLFDTYQVTLPLIIARDPVGYLPVFAEYFYTPQDSMVRLISYDWEKEKYGNFFDKPKLWKKESKKLDTYNEEYERVRKILIGQLGTPTAADTKLKEVSYERGSYFTRETSWETEELHAELSMIFESATYRVRLTLYWKK